MSFCPACGAPTRAGISFCTSCGAALTAAAPAGGHASPHAVGQRREPLLVVVLTVVTLGFYALYYWWVASKELDAYAGKPGRAHGAVRLGVLLSLAGVAALLFAGVGIVAAALAAARGPPDGGAALGAFLGAVGTLFVVGFILLAGTVVLLVGKYRLWEELEAQERRRGETSPLSAGLMLALAIVGFVVPFLGWVLSLAILWMTADHLDRLRLNP